MDFDYFIENLIATHPYPFTAFGNEIEFYGEKQKIKEEIKKISTDDEFVFLLNKFVSRLEDGDIDSYLQKINEKPSRFLKP